VCVFQKIYVFFGFFELTSEVIDDLLLLYQLLNDL